MSANDASVGGQQAKCEGRGVIYTRYGVNDWNAEECPGCDDCLPVGEASTMTEAELIAHLAEYVLVCYPDGDASETMVVERVIDALRGLPRRDVEVALWGT